MATVAAEKLARGELNELDAAKAVRDGDLPSPTKLGEFWLFALRVTGTGAAWRDSIEEFAFRDPSIWLSNAFLERAAVVPIIFEHPEKAGLNSEEYRDRVIGNAMISFIKGDEVWCVGRINDQDAALAMQHTHCSTSPGVSPPKGSTPTTTEGGQQVLSEGLPLLLDHLAVCERGVWDKNEEVSGIRLDHAKERSVDEAEKKRLEDERKALQDKLDAANRRADSAEAKTKELEDARKDAEAKAKKDADEEKERADKSKRDAEETERQAVEKAEKEKADAKRDARKSRHDSEKHDGAHNDCSRCDAFEKGEVEDKKKDAVAAVETVNAEVDKLQDARRADSKRIEELAAEIAALKRQPTMDDANAIATAYHRYDSIYQMLGERVPQHMPGESPIAYRRRLADGLRKHTKTWKEHVLHDAVTGPAFDMLEDSIISEALAEAKNPTRTDANAGRLIERTTVQNGKTRTEFYGDSSVAFAPFEAPVMSFKFKKPTKAA